MSKTIKFIFLLILLLTIFNKQLIIHYCSYKFSKWTERKLVFDKFYIDYPNKIEINGIQIKNSNNFFYDNLIESDKVILELDPKSLFFSNLIIIEKLVIEKPKFFLDIVESKNDLKSNGKKPKNYSDNIGLAKKINKNLPAKIWPEKKRDINFLILKTSIIDAKALIKVSTISKPSETKLSNMYFNKIGNEKNYQHYKDVLKIILFDIMASTTNSDLKKILKDVYKY